MCWIGLLKHKDEAFEKFQIFKALVENELELKISVLDLIEEENINPKNFLNSVNNTA